MPMQTVESLVEGGKASAAPPLGPALGPLGINIGQVIADINKKTALFAGMQVPIKVHVDTVTKAFTISVGTPPASALIKKEAGIEKGSSNPLMDKVADLRIEQIIKVAKMKETQLLGKGLKGKLKEVLGTCNSMGILVEGKPAFEVIQMVNDGAFAEEIEKRKEEFLARAKAIVEAMVGKPRGEIKAKLVEASIPTKIIDELLPATTTAPEGGKPGAAGAAPAGGAKKEEKK